MQALALARRQLLHGHSARRRGARRAAARGADVRSVARPLELRAALASAKIEGDRWWMRARRERMRRMAGCGLQRLSRRPICVVSKQTGALTIGLSSPTLLPRFAPFERSQ